MADFDIRGWQKAQKTQEGAETKVKGLVAEQLKAMLTEGITEASQENTLSRLVKEVLAEREMSSEELMEQEPEDVDFAVEDDLVDDDDMEMDGGMQADADFDMDAEMAMGDEMGMEEPAADPTADVDGIEDLLKQALRGAEAFGDDKLNQQIQNTLTYLFRTYVTNK